MFFQTINATIRGLHSADTDVRLNALNTIHETDLEAIEPQVLIPLLRDEDETIRLLAIWTLTDLNDPLAIPALLDSVADSNAENAAAARAALLEFRTRDAVDPLLEGLKHSFHGARAAAIAALRELRNPRSIPALRAALNDPSTEVRVEAIKALAAIPNSGAIDALRWTFFDTDASVRRAAVGVAANLNEDGALPYIVRAVRDQDWQVRRDAAKALQNYPKRGSVLALRRALRDVHPLVVTEAINSLGRLRAPVARDIKRFLDSADSKMRAIAMKALDEIERTKVNQHFHFSCRHRTKLLRDLDWQPLGRWSLSGVN